MTELAATYEDILKKIYHLPRSPIRSLSAMKRMAEALDHPERFFRVIHVAGTNGKGSVCTKIAAALMFQGYSCALYTSPHISSFCERIQVDREMISEDDVCELYAQIEEAALLNELTLSFFEIATLLAFLYFRKKKVEIAVIETGIGGSFDATNIVLPLVSIITSIGFDHMDILGSSLEEICHAKAGIIKPKVPVVIGKTVPSQWILPTARQMSSPFFQADGAHLTFDGENQETARLALNVISNQIPIDSAALEQGLKITAPCRFELHHLEPTIILDVAHNPQGLIKLLSSLNNYNPHASIRFICGFSKGKEIHECAAILQRKAAAIHIVSGAHPRLAKADEIAPYFDPEKTALYLEPSMNEALKHARKSLDLIVITGSFFIMEEAQKELFKIKNREKIPCS